MPNVVFVARACKFEKIGDGPMTVRSHKPFDRALEQFIEACRTIADVERYGNRLFSAVSEAHPGQSFFMTASIQAGQRAMAGFNKRTWKWEHDCDTGAVIQPEPADETEDEAHEG